MKKMPFIFIVLIINTICFVLNTNPAYAQGVSLSTYPSTIQLRAEKSNVAQAGFMLENKSNAPIKLKIALKPFMAAPSNDGKLIYIEGSDPALFKNVKLFDNDLAVSTVELGPKQRKQLRVEVATQANEPNADQYFSVIFLPVEPTLTEEIAEEASAQSITQAGIALNVLLQTGPKEIPNGLLEEFSTEPFRTTGPVPFTITLKNNGNHYFTPKGVILIKNIFSQTVGKVDLQNANILVGTSRSLTGIPYHDSAKEKSAFLSATPTWPEKFLLGFYTAELSVALSDEGPVLTHSTTFFAMPIRQLFGIGISILFLILLVIRIRKKIKAL